MDYSWAFELCLWGLRAYLGSTLMLESVNLANYVVDFEKGIENILRLEINLNVLGRCE